MGLTVRCIPADISEAQRKDNIEGLFTAIIRITKVENFSHCIYDVEQNKVRIFIEAK
jgi:hypothetical protein